MSTEEGTPVPRAIRLLRNAPPFALDATIVAVLIGLGLLEQLPAQSSDSYPQAVHAAVVVAAVLPLLARHRFAFLVLVAIAAVTGITGSLPGPPLALSPGPAGFYALLIATFSAAAGCKRGLGWIALALALATATLELRPWVLPVAAWLPNYPPIVAVFVAGRAQRRRMELTNLLAGHLVDMRAQRERLHRIALQEVRTALARDLHDVVAHALLRMTASAREAMSKLRGRMHNPQPALAATEATGRAALAEMRRLLEVLRGDTAGEERVAQPDLLSLENLVRGAFPPGTNATLRLEGDVAHVPPPVALAAYRIVQEALTNTRRHSDAKRVDILVTSDDTGLRLAVRDDGSALPRESTSRIGLGITGMRERAALFGGSLEVIPDGSNGYAVTAWLPFHETTAVGAAADQTSAADAQAPAIIGADSAVPAMHPRIPGIVQRLLQLEWPLDVGLIAVLGVTAWLEFGPGHAVIPGLPPAANDPYSTAALVWAQSWIALLLLRRRLPVVTAVAMAVMAFLQTYPFYFWTPASDIFALQIAVYTVGKQRPRGPHAWVVALLGAVGLVSVQPVTLSYVSFLAISCISLGGAAYIGRVFGERNLLNAELDHRLSALGEERRAELALAIQQDRLSLAREMHDLVAHTISLMVVQAGAARTVAASEPEAAREAIRAVIAAGEEAVLELNQVLSLLRAGGTEEARPATRRDVDGLVMQARQSGLDVQLSRRGSHAPPSGGSLELSTYRIVQECLTNVRKHAPGSRVVVHLIYGPDSVEVRVQNDGAAAPARDLSTLGAGHGLLGMRERVAMFGGRLRAEPVATGGFLVDAMMPRDRAAAS